jgi:putative endonuclease
MLSTYKFGIIAEYLAVLLLKIKMYRIVAMRYRNHAGEIDIIAVKNNVIVFIEVKARTNDNGYELVHQKQIKRIRNAASLFLAQHSKYQSKEVRFDLMVVVDTLWPRHLENMW